MGGIGLAGNAIDFGKIIVEAVRNISMEILDVFKMFFVPRKEYIDSKFDELNITINNKFSIIDEVKVFIKNFHTKLEELEELPIEEMEETSMLETKPQNFNAPKSELTKNISMKIGGIQIYIIDLLFVYKFRAIPQTIILLCSYYRYGQKVLKRLPSIF
jgi:hypothetical protein